VKQPEGITALQSDHWPVIAHIDTHQPDPPPQNTPSKPSTKGWLPTGIVAAASFKTKACNLIHNATSLQNIIEQLHTIARQTPHTTLNQRNRNSNTHYNRTIRNLAAEIALTTQPAEAKALRAQINKQKRLRRLTNQDKQFKKMIDYKTYTTTNITRLLDDDDNPAPLSNWIPMATNFGRRRFNQPNSSSPTDTKNRIDEIMSQIAADKKDGLPQTTFTYFDSLQARAKLRVGKAPDNEGTNGDMLLCLPFYAVIDIHKLFHQLYLDPTLSHPEQWTNVDFKGIPKTRETDKLDKLRWIVGINVFRQWYSRVWGKSLIPRSPPPLLPTGPHLWLHPRFRTRRCSRFRGGRHP